MKQINIYTVAAMVRTDEEYPFAKSFNTKEEAKDWIMEDREATQKEWGEPCTMTLPNTAGNHTGDYILRGDKSGYSVIYHIYEDTFIFDEKKAVKVAKSE